MLSERLKTMFSETDKLDELNELVSECVNLETTLETSREEIDSLNGQIAELRDTNMKLFLKVQGETQEEEEEKEVTIDEIFEEIIGG